MARMRPFKRRGTVSASFPGMPVRELELTFRLRNNRLKERREALRVTQPELAAAAGVELSTYRALEAMRTSPQARRKGCLGWRDVSHQLARFHCVEPDELFPPVVLAVKTPVTRRRIDGDDTFPLLSAHQEQLLESPKAAHDRAELREQLRRILASLNPRDAEVLRLRFGLDDGEERTLDQVGRILNVQRERVRQLEARAMRMLHPRRASTLRAFLPGAEEPDGRLARRATGIAGDADDAVRRTR